MHQERYSGIKLTGRLKDKLKLILTAVSARSGLLDEQHTAALRLFNGYSEGYPGLVIDLYARTMVIFNQLQPSTQMEPLISSAWHRLLEQLPWLQAVMVKHRYSSEDRQRRGILVYGKEPDHEIREFGVRYALDLDMNQDASFYLDTRNLRSWLQQEMHVKRVLNTFAYTGSLGAAALAGGAVRVKQLDLSSRFLSLAQRTYRLNNFTVREDDFLVGDFFRQTARLKRRGELFDCVILDPPFFSVTDAGRVDLEREFTRLINKVRPLVGHNGWLVTVNNALFVPGGAYLASLKNVCSSGYLQLEKIIPVPLDGTGYPETVQNPSYPADPAPFNHPTKIAVLRVARKDEVSASQA